MINKKPIVLFLFFLLLCSCQKTDDNSLVIIDGENISEETSLNFESLVDSIVGNLLFSPLLYDRSHARLMPHNVLVREVKILDGNKLVEVRLKDGIRFYDGREFTAKDILPAVNKLREELAGKYGDMFKYLQVDVIDKTSFILTNSFPMFNTYQILAGIQAYPQQFTGNPTGTGPFKINRWLDSGVELVANETYFEGAPSLKKIIYLHEKDERKRLYKLLKGDADLMVFLSPDAARFLEKDERFHVKKISSGMYSAIFFNNRSPLFADKAIRKAVSMAINRETLIEKGLKGAGIQAFGPFPKTISQRSDNQEYHPRKAASLLNEVGWKYNEKGLFLEKNNRKLSFSLYYMKGVEDFKKVVDVIAQQLFEIGIKVVGIPIDHDEFIKQNLGSQDYDAYLSIVSSRESYNFLQWHSSSEKNLSSFNSGKVDRLLTKMRETGEVEEKELLYGSLQRIFNEEASAAFLYNNVISTAVNKKFNGAEDFAGDVYNLYKVKDWSVNEDFR